MALAAIRRLAGVMNVTVRIADELAARLAADGGDVERRAREAFALAEFQAGRPTRPELRRLPGFGTRHELDGFLKTPGVNEGMTVEEFERDRARLDRLGL
jgi:hypothetical protein